MQLRLSHFRKESIVMLLVFLFLYTALSKYAEHSRFYIVLRTSPLVKIGNLAYYISWGLPALEIFLVLLLIIPRTRLLGLYASAILLTIFTIYLTYMVIFTPHLPCSCGGVISKMSWKQHIFFNLGFVALSLIAATMQRKFINDNKSNTDNRLSFA